MKLFDHLDATAALTEDEAILLGSVQTVARDKIAPRATAYDASGEFPWDNVKEINALGLNAMFVPEAYGGAELSFSAYLACAREISKACAATGIIWATNFHAMKPVIDFAPEDQKKRFLPKLAEGALASLCITEPNAGSDATGMVTKFTPDGNAIIVNGGQTFIKIYIHLESQAVNHYYQGIHLKY